MVKRFNQLLFLSFMALLCGFAYIYFATVQYDAIEQQEISCAPDTIRVPDGKNLRVVSWNVQFMAGADRVFWYDLPAEASQESFTHIDRQIPQEAVVQTLENAIALIRRLNPDILLLQEVADHYSLAGDYSQSQHLVQALSDQLPCHVSTPYWDSPFVPHPMIMGSANLQLLSMSRYQISDAQRIQLPRMPEHWVVKHFGLQRALQELTLPTSSGSTLVVMNTHLDAFAQGFDTMSKQVKVIDQKLVNLNVNNTTWVLGGDLNLLLPGHRELLPTSSQQAYNQESELIPLLKHRIYPSPDTIAQTDRKTWRTYTPNYREESSGSRILDYLILSPAIHLDAFKVHNDPADKLSDHFPLVGDLQIPNSVSDSSAQ